MNMNRAALLEARATGLENVDVIAVGKRGGDALERAGAKVVARFAALSNNPSLQDLLPVARLALDGFLAGNYKTVKLGYTDFISGITQKPRLVDLLPIAPLSEQATDKGQGQVATADYTFEPNANKVLQRVLPAIAETMLWQALLESTASEHAARMMAMKSATDAAKDMLEALTFTYNQARQSSITQEIAEISSGKAALE